MNQRAVVKRRIVWALMFAFATAAAFPDLVVADGVTQAWVKRYDGPANGVDWANAIAVDGDGNVYVTGDSEAANGNKDYATIKYLSDGTRAWVKRYNGPANGDDIANAIAVDGKGNVYVTGDSEAANGNSDYATIKYLSDGTQAWVRRYNGPAKGWDYAVAIAVDGEGNVYVTGASQAANGKEDYATIKYLSDGTQAWVKRYNGRANGNDSARAIAVDGKGNVCVTGTSMGAQGWRDYATVKYLSDGTQAWVKRYDGPANGNDRAHAVAVDGGGNVYVTGESGAANGTDDYATIKYLSDGTRAWVKRYDGPANGNDGAHAVAVDGDGKVYVTGYSSSESGVYFDWATIKYLRNGTEAWVKRYDGPAYRHDRAYAIVTDATGNVYVTGESGAANGKANYATVKYLSSGAQAWVKRYNGPGNGDDEARAIAVDGKGNVYVTGASDDAAGVFDYATIKYQPD